MRPTALPPASSCQLSAGDAVVHAHTSEPGGRVCGPVHLARRPAPAGKRLLDLARRLAAATLLLGLPLHGTAVDTATLYQQLGGREGIQAVTGRLIDRSARDPRTAAALRSARLAPLKRQVADYVCELAGGPCVFRDAGAAAYGQLAVTETAFAVMMATLREELQASGVAVSAQAELLRRLSPPTSAVILAETPL
jgi:hemoglobin